MQKKRILRIGIITLFLVSLFFISLYVYAIRSEPYAAAVNYLTQSDEIRESLGPMTSFRLPFLGYSVRYDGSHGNAEYKIIVKSERADIYLTIEKSVGVWEIVEANMVLENGEIISLIK